MPISRNVSIKAVFAKNANTTIPITPTAGTSYRDESVTQTEVENGWPFKTIVDSSKFNEIIYQISSICKLLEEFGMLPWSAQTDYVTGSFCLGSDGKLYQALQASGPSTTVREPTANVGTYWNLYGSDYFVTLGTTQTISGPKTLTDCPTILKNAGNFIVLKNTEITAGTAPSATKQSLIKFFDSNDNSMGTIYQNYNTDGSVDMRFNTTARSGGNSYTATFTLRAFPDGTRYAIVPESDVVNSVVTTAGINKAQNGYVKLGNGMIIQWGKYSGPSGTVTFKTPFTSGTSYSVSTGYIGSERYDHMYGVVNTLTSTGFNVVTFGSGSACHWVAIGY